MGQITDQLRGAWAGNGKKWVIGGAVLGLGYLWWTRVRGQKPGGGGASAAITPGGAAVADPITPPGGDYSTPAGPAPRPQSNAEWLSEATAALILPPKSYAPTAVWNALTKALAGDPLTTAEIGIVEDAIRSVGSPPEGMPRLNMASTAPPTSTSPPTPPPSAPPSPAPVTYKVVSGDTLEKIGKRWNTTSSAVYSRNASVIEAAARAHGLSSSRGGPNNSLGWWIYPGTVLTKP